MVYLFSYLPILWWCLKKNSLTLTAADSTAILIILLSFLMLLLQLLAYPLLHPMLVPTTPMLQSSPSPLAVAMATYFALNLLFC